MTAARPRRYYRCCPHCNPTTGTHGWRHNLHLAPCGVPAAECQEGGDDFVFHADDPCWHCGIRWDECTCYLGEVAP